MAKVIEKKGAVSASKKLIKKTKNQEKNIDSISLKRITRSSTLLNSIEIEREKKSQPKVLPRATRSSKLPSETSSKPKKKSINH